MMEWREEPRGPGMRARTSWAPMRLPTLSGTLSSEFPNVTPILSRLRSLAGKLCSF